MSYFVMQGLRFIGRFLVDRLVAPTKLYNNMAQPTPEQIAFAQIAQGIPG